MRSNEFTTTLTVFGLKPRSGSVVLFPFPHHKLSFSWKFVMVLPRLGRLAKHFLFSVTEQIQVFVFSTDIIFWDCTQISWCLSFLKKKYFSSPLFKRTLEVKKMYSVETYCLELVVFLYHFFLIFFMSLQFSGKHKEGQYFLSHRNTIRIMLHATEKQLVLQCYHSHKCFPFYHLCQLYFSNI